MKKSTNVTLSKERDPKFPDKCIVCERKPNSLTKTFRSPTNAWIAAVFPFVQLFDWECLKVPICRSCKFRFHFQDWGREIALWIYFILIFIWLFPILQEKSQITSFLILCAIICISIIPYLLLNYYYPKYLNLEYEDETIDYEFSSSLYAYEFENLNKNFGSLKVNTGSFSDIVKKP